MINKWKVNVSEVLIEDLADSFHNGPIQENGTLLLNEKFVDKIKGLKIEIFSNEHPPPHFRVIYQGETANYSIKDCEKINGDLDTWVRNIKKWHLKNKYKLIKIWDETRPSDCTVGEYIYSNDEIEDIKSIVDKKQAELQTAQLESDSWNSGKYKNSSNANVSKIYVTSLKKEITYYTSKLNTN